MPKIRRASQSKWWAGIDPTECDLPGLPIGDRWPVDTTEPLNAVDDHAPLIKPEDLWFEQAHKPGWKIPETTFLWTGLRTSELIALDWDRDIDFVREKIRITQANTRAAKGQPEDTKTSAGRRVIKMLPPVSAALLSQKAITQLRGQAVFINAGTGNRWTGDNQIWKIWQTIIKKAKIRYRNPYQTRHTFASMRLSAGERPMWVTKRMSHKDWTMIARIYGKWMPTADLQVGLRAVALFSEAIEQLSSRVSPSLR